MWCFLTVLRLRGTILQTDEVMGMAAISVDASLVDAETRKEIHVIPLGNSYP
mgnify:CR=1 FL=1